MSWVLGGLGLLGACVCTGVGLALVAAVAWMLFRPAAHQRRQSEDRRDPRRAWVQGAAFGLMGGADYAYMPEGDVRRLLADGWSITDPAQWEAVVADLEGKRDELAWNLARAMLLTRAAVAVGTLDNTRSWERALAQGVKLQGAYPSWRAFADDLLASRRRWRGLPIDGSGDDADMREVVDAIRALESDLWKKVSWARALE